LTRQTVNLSDLADAIKGFADAHVEDQKAAVVRGLYRSLPLLAERSPVDQGQYAASWAVEEGAESVSIGNFAPHAPIIEYGARPFTPPIGPLLAWAKRILQDGSQPPDYSPRVWELARGTQNKIRAQGMAPKHVLTGALPDILHNIKLEFERFNG